MSLAGAVLFARWMAVLAAIVAVALLAGLLAPWIYPVGMVLVGPLFMFSLGYFWHREARRGVAPGPAPPSTTGQPATNTGDATR